MHRIELRSTLRIVPQMSLRLRVIARQSRHTWLAPRIVSASTSELENLLYYCISVDMTSYHLLENYVEDLGGRDLPHEAHV